MQIHVDRAVFAEAIATASSFTVKESKSIPLIRIDASASELIITATDMERVCRIAVDCQTRVVGSVMVDASRISVAVRGATKAALTVSLKGNRLTIEGGVSYSIPTMDIIDIDMPPMPEADAEVNGAALARSIGATSYAIAAGDVRYGLNGAYFEQVKDELEMTATDGHRLAHSAVTIKGRLDIDRLTLVSREACAGLARLGGMLRIAFGAGWVHARIGRDHYAWRCVVGEFPSYRDVVPGESTSFATFRTSEILAASKRAAAVLTKAQLPTGFAFGDSEVMMSTVGESELRESVTTELDGKPASFGARALYVAEAVASLGNVDKVTFDFTHPMAPIRIRPSDESASWAIVMPMRID